MRRRPVSMIFRELASLCEELALHAENGEQVPAGTHSTKAKTPRRAPSIVRPSGQSDEVTEARARRILREYGYAEAKR